MSVAYQFADCVLNLRERTLYCAGRPVELSPKELQTLTLLIERAGEAVSREWLIEQIWPNTVVGDTSLGRCVSALRKHLGVDAIRSLPKFGYRFTLPVTVVEVEAPLREPRPISRSQKQEEDIVVLDHIPTAETVGQSSSSQTPSAEPKTEQQPQSTRWSMRRLAWAAVALVAAGAALTGFAVHWLRVKRVQGIHHAAAKRWETEGLFALYDGTAYRATRAFDKAIELESSSPLLHAHAADALLQLERTGDAQDQILLAIDLNGVGSLTRTERHYLNAVRAMAARDFSTAIQEYESWTKDLPAQDRWQGEEDLGRAYSAAGRTAEAIMHFQRAVALEPERAGVYLRLARIQGLQRHWQEAVAQLAHASALYEHDSNLEGEAEVAYMRGTMELQQARYVPAADFYRRSLELSHQLRDLQLEGRAVGALSTVERAEGRLDESFQDAQEALRLGRQSGSDYSIAGSLTLVANVALARRDAATARPLLEEALRLEGRVKNMRQTANAEYSLATLLAGTGDYSQAAEFAIRAREHYRANHSIDGVSAAELLWIDTRRAQGDHETALQRGLALLRTSIDTGSKRYEEEAEAGLGRTLRLMERDNEALIHLRRAVALSVVTQHRPWLMTLYLADALAELGRVGEARAAMTAVPAAVRDDPDAERQWQMTEAALAVAEGRCDASIRHVRAAKALAMGPAETAREWLAEGRGNAAEGRWTDVAAAVGSLITLPVVATNPYLRLQADILRAESAVAEHRAGDAEAYALSALHSSQLRQFPRSQWIANAVLSRAEALNHKADASRRAAAAAETNISSLQQTMSATEWQMYVKHTEVHRQVQYLLSRRP